MIYGEPNTIRVIGDVLLGILQNREAVAQVGIFDVRRNSLHCYLGYNSGLIYYQ